MFLQVKDGGANGETEIFLNLVNQQLPNEMKVFSMHRVTKKFDARWRCERRFYEYLMPTFMFSTSISNVSPRRRNSKKIKKTNSRSSSSSSSNSSNSSISSNSSNSSNSSISSISSNSSNSTSSTSSTSSTTSSTTDNHTFQFNAVHEAESATTFLRGKKESWATRAKYEQEKQRKQKESKKVATFIQPASTTASSSSSTTTTQSTHSTHSTQSRPQSRPDGK